MRVAASYLLGVTIVHSNPFSDGVRVDEAVVGLVSGYNSGSYDQLCGVTKPMTHLLTR